MYTILRICIESGASMNLSPLFYHHLVRPKRFTQKYVHRLIQDHIPFRGKNVLDFGSGTGANCVICEPNKYIGIDPDQQRIHFAKRLYPDYHFDVLDDQALPVKEASLDIILIVAVLHHIPPQQLEHYMAEFRKVLKQDGGAIVVMEPCFLDTPHICNWYMNMNDNGNYIQNEAGYLTCFENAGFNCHVLKKYKKGFFYNELFFIAY
jgi:SAM-dependent methyltransferase